MQDGRGLEGWWSGGSQQHVLEAPPIRTHSSQPPPMTNWDYRRYLQTHGRTIMQHNMAAAVDRSGNTPYVYSVTSFDPNEGPKSDLYQEYVAKYKLGGCVSERAPLIAARLKTEQM